MTSAPLPTEEERRLLREYRLTKVPGRRCSTSPRISKTNTIGNNNNNNNGNNIVNGLSAVAATSTGTRTINSPIITTTSSSTNTTTSTSNQTNSVSTSTNTIGTSTNSNNNNHNSKDTTTNHQHGHHHHHHSSNHRRHKNATPFHELTAEELNRMLELVSELDYLKLVSPKSVSINNDNNSNGTTKLTTKPTNNNKATTMNTTTTMLTNSCTPYIFEKVDYIKKISLQKEAFRRLKKARSKSRVISPNTTSLTAKQNS